MCGSTRFAKMDCKKKKRSNANHIAFLFWTCLRFLSIVWIFGSETAITAQFRTACYNSVTQRAANSGAGWHHELQLHTTHLSTESRMLQWDLTCSSVYYTSVHTPCGGMMSRCAFAVCTRRVLDAWPLTLFTVVVVYFLFSYIYVSINMINEIKLLMHYYWLFLLFFLSVRILSALYLLIPVIGFFLCAICYMCSLCQFLLLMKLKSINYLILTANMWFTFKRALWVLCCH